MKVYFAGAIKGGREKVYDYQKMVQELEKNGGIVLDKHVADPKLSSNGENITPKEIFERDVAWIREADIVFADISLPSLGIGYELAYAEKYNKKVYGVFEKNANVSYLIRGNENFTFYEYESIEDVLNYINKIMK